VKLKLELVVEFMPKNDLNFVKFKANMRKL